MSAKKAAAAVMACAAFATGCYSTGEGLQPTSDLLYFPVGLAVSPQGKWLYVANSDFDLQFSGGNVQAFNLDDLRKNVEAQAEAAANPAPGTACPPNPNPTLHPGPCDHFDLLEQDSVEIGAFGTDLLRQPTGGDAQNPASVRLFVPVPGDPSLSYIQVLDEDTNVHFSCGQPAKNGRCDAAHRIGTDPNQVGNSRGIVLPEEPFALASTKDGSVLVATHVTTGQVSLFTNPPEPDSAPVLQFLLPLASSALAPAGVAAVPIPRVADPKYYSMGPPQQVPAYRPGFLATFRNSAELDLLRYYDDAQAAPRRAYMTLAARSGLGNVNANGADSRGIAFDDTDSAPRIACENQCADGDLDCYAVCARIPLDVYVVNRTPPGLLVGKTQTIISDTGSNDLVTFNEPVRLEAGASRVVIGPIKNAQGELENRVFVTCFDARLVMIYNPKQGLMEAAVRTGRGPYAIALDVDSTHAYAYVAHFTDSYIGVIDLDETHANFETMVGTAGTPQIPRETK